MSMTQNLLHRSPLFETHQKEGAKLISFGGWEMPLEYKGILAEHEAVRNNAGLFDLSHMGELELIGDQALSFVNTLVTNDVEALKERQICYTVACKEDGTILDDLLVYRLPKKVLLVVNAGNREKIIKWIQQHLPAGVVLTDSTFDLALLAVQGPKAQEYLSKLVDRDLEDIPYYWGRDMKVCGIESLVSRTGYTGEDGFEIYVKSDKAQLIWEKLRDTGVAPVGLGARDTLRLEACYALYGHEIDETRIPLEAGLSWVVRLKKAHFIGKNSLVTEKEQGLKNQLIGFKMLERVIPRQGYLIKTQTGKMGIVTSGTFSPTLKIGVGMGYLPCSEVASCGTKVFVEIRNKWHEAEVVKRPFYQGSVRIKR